MERKIMFRGESITPVETLNRFHVKHENGLVYGHLLNELNDYYIVGGIEYVDEDFIVPEFWVKVDPKTIGQFTGFYDKDGKEIYEGDIVVLNDGGTHFAHTVIWDKEIAGFVFMCDGVPWLAEDMGLSTLCKVVGNIY